MNTTDILFRTTKGDQEIATQANKLPIKHRSVLIMIDGKSSMQAVQSKLSGMFDGKAILEDLEKHGFIEGRAGAKPALQAIDAGSVPLNVAAKKYMIDSIYQVLGPEADSIVARIEKCKSNSDLAAMATTCRDTMAGLGKRKRAEDLELKMKEMLA